MTGYSSSQTITGFRFSGTNANQPTLYNNYLTNQTVNSFADGPPVQLGRIYNSTGQALHYFPNNSIVKPILNLTVTTGTYTCPVLNR